MKWFKKYNDWLEEPQYSARFAKQVNTSEQIMDMFTVLISVVVLCSLRWMSTIGASTFSRPDTYSKLSFLISARFLEFSKLDGNIPILLAPYMIKEQSTSFMTL